MFGAHKIKIIEKMVCEHFPKKGNSINKSIFNSAVSASSHIILEDKKENKSYKLLWVTGDYWAIFLLGDKPKQLDFFQWNDERALSMLQSIFGKEK